MRIVDFHSHILPQMDDGSSSVAESIQMLKMEQEQNIGHVVATPHFYPHREKLEGFLARREVAADALRNAAPSGYPQIYLGAEVPYFPGMSDSDALKCLVIDGGRGILVEMPMEPWTDRMFQELEDIYTKQGLTPIIAHIERYLFFWRNRKIPQRLAELPVLVQANANFFLNKRKAKAALKMFQKGQIHLLGSDCHNQDVRLPNLGNAVESISSALGNETLERLDQYQTMVLGLRL